MSARDESDGLESTKRGEDGVVVQACSLSSRRLRQEYCEVEESRQHCEASSGKEVGERYGQVLGKKVTRTMALFQSPVWLLHGQMALLA